MRKNYKNDRKAEDIKRIISTLLLKEIKDPKLSATMISISEVKLTRDGSYATVFISLLGNDEDSKISTEEEKEEIIAAMERAKGFFRTKIGESLELRHTPELIFKIDTSQEYSMHIEKLIDQINSEDKNDKENE